MFVTFKNKYSENFLNKNQNHLKPNSRAKKWKPVTLFEIQSFVTVLINMDIKPQPTVYSYWWTYSSHPIPWFPRIFTRNRFQAILQFFHMVDCSNLPKSGQPNYDPCARFNPLVDHVNRLFKHYFVPGQKLSVDESMISTKSNSQLKQYLLRKHHRWGVKLWMFCDSATYHCINFFVYRGSDRNEIKEKGKGHTIIVKLLEIGNLLNKDYYIFVDNFFTSLKH
uniref:PiggyBac transposable element-derived protein domain-containing protein n=1 Tax=Homalodisca liturata TaxID=320908 RepID=A0A1B6J5P2_9HEMI